MTASKKNLLSLFELSSEEIMNIISEAQKIKKNRFTEKSNILNGKTGVMIFEKPSLRTRITFETAINELGGHPIVLPSDTIGMGKRESVEDIARNLERWVHLIIARTFSHSTVEQLAKFSNIPVINALTDTFHPCQALAFALTVHERFEAKTKINVVFLGDGNNVCNSIMILCAKLGYNFTAVCPEKYSPSHDIFEKCREIGKSTGSKIEVSHEILGAVKYADILYTDVWTSMCQEQEMERRRLDFKQFQLNKDVLAHAPSDVLVSHCLPAHRGEEITSEILDSKISVAFDEAENRLHAQKAVIVHLFS
ncbi:MAG: ornithine carbamoyltransferase [Fibrobacter sp.]|nr:ornithine carbamoyltransferase [Fibrobacter sp.]